MVRKKSWSSVINPFLKKTKTETSKVFKEFRTEVKAKRIKTITEENKLWRKKYKPKLNVIEKKHDREYDKIWKKFHKK